MALPTILAIRGFGVWAGKHHALPQDFQMARTLLATTDQVNPTIPNASRARRSSPSTDLSRLAYNEPGA